MPIQVTENWSDWEYGATQATRVFIVTGVSEGADALSAPGIPQVNNTHPRNNQLLAEPPVVRTPKGPLWFEVWVRYSIPSAGSHDTGGTVDPLLEPWEIEWQPTESSDPHDRDSEGNAIVFSNRLPPDPAPTRTTVNWFVTYRRNEREFDFINANRFIHRVNSNEFTLVQPDGRSIVVPVGACQCQLIAPAGPFKATAQYVKIAYVFELRPYPEWFTLTPSVDLSPFQLWMLDQGEMAFYNAAGRVEIGKIVDGDGKAVTGPVLLNGQGAPLDTRLKVTGARVAAVNQPTPTGGRQVYGPADTSGNTPSYLVYKRYAGADFSTIGI